MCFQPAVSVDAATVAGPGETIDLGRNAALHTAIVSATGAPSVQVYLEISHDGTNWASQNNASGSSFPFIVHTERVARYVRANVTSLTGGASPTVSVTIASA